jgi:hypothetical protein
MAATLTGKVARRKLELQRQRERASGSAADTASE